jgi:hypothetical protein
MMHRLKIHPFQADNKTLYLLESKTNETLPLVLSAPFTSMMDILSSTRIYCLYPDLLVSEENLSNNRSFLRHGRQADGLRPFNYGLRTYMSTDIWSTSDRTCDDNCPAILREVQGLPGVSVMKWGGIHGLFDTTPSDISVSDGFEHKNYGWQLGGACGNTNCPFFGRGTPLRLHDVERFNHSL